MPGTVKNHLLMEKYKERGNGRYAEPEDEVVLVSFLALPPVGQGCKRDTRSEKKHETEKEDQRKLSRKRSRHQTAFL